MVSDEENLRAKILLAGASGAIEPEAAHAMMGILSGEPLLKSSPDGIDKALGKDTIYQSLDIQGNVLISGNNYLFGEQKVKVLREQQGAGNMLDVYMRVFYIDSSLEEKCTTIDGSYPKGVLNGAVYQSPFEPIPEEE